MGYCFTQHIIFGVKFEASAYKIIDKEEISVVEPRYDTVTGQAKEYIKIVKEEEIAHYSLLGLETELRENAWPYDLVDSFNESDLKHNHKDIKMVYNAEDGHLYLGIDFFKDYDNGCDTYKYGSAFVEDVYRKIDIIRAVAPDQFIQLHAFVTIS